MSYFYFSSFFFCFLLPSPMYLSILLFLLVALSLRSSGDPLPCISWFCLLILTALNVLHHCGLNTRELQLLSVHLDLCMVFFFSCYFIPHTLTLHLCILPPSLSYHEAGGPHRRQGGAVGSRVRRGVCSVRL